MDESRMFLLKRGCGCLNLDEIVKDIRDRKDNAMAMEFTKCIVKLLRKNGVAPKITEVRTGGTFDKERNVIEERYGVLIEGLDFSEHDKVFEDKIASLEKQIEKLKGEKSFLRTRCMPYIERDFDNGLYGNLAIVGCNEEFVDIQKYADGDDLYSMEVRNLLSEGGLERLIGQYRTISCRLDKMSAENRGLQKNVKDYEDKISKIEKELEEWKEEARAVKKQRDKQLKSFREGIEPYVDLLHMHETIADKDKKIAELEKGMGNYKQAFEDKCNDYNFTSDLLDKFISENEALEKRIAELESKQEDNSPKEPISDCKQPSIEWYDNRHQSDCIEINRLNTTIDVLIHKIEYLRQLAGLE